jgi:hypothetical protein
MTDLLLYGKSVTVRSDRGRTNRSPGTALSEVIGSLGRGPLILPLALAVSGCMASSQAMMQRACRSLSETLVAPHSTLHPAFRWLNLNHVK